MQDVYKQKVIRENVTKRNERNRRWRSKMLQRGYRSYNVFASGDIIDKLDAYYQQLKGAK